MGMGYTGARAGCTDDNFVLHTQVVSHNFKVFAEELDANILVYRENSKIKEALVNCLNKFFEALFLGSVK